MTNERDKFENQYHELLYNLRVRTEDALRRKGPPIEYEEKFDSLVWLAEAEVRLRAAVISPHTRIVEMDTEQAILYFECGLRQKEYDALKGEDYFPPPLAQIIRDVRRWKELYPEQATLVDEVMILHYVKSRGVNPNRKFSKEDLLFLEDNDIGVRDRLGEYGRVYAEIFLKGEENES